MILKPVDEVESSVVEVLSRRNSPATISEVVAAVQNEVHGLQAAQVKVATLNLVSQGRAKLDDAWRIVISKTE